MRTFKSTLVFLLLIVGVIACNDDLTTLAPEGAAHLFEKEMEKAATKLEKATGSVEIVWKGGGKKSVMGNQAENLRAFFEFNAHESKNATDAKGEVVFKVIAPDSTLHREIIANVYGVRFNNAEKKAWFVARVSSDSKGCTGGPGGHDSSCSDDHTDEGGCSDDHTDEGGCSNDHTDEGGHDSGCSHDETDEGGCTDVHEDGESCSDSHPGDDSEHDSGTRGNEDKGNPMSGKNCRLGQIMVVKVHDVSTPGKDGDGLTWKWFSEENSPDINDYLVWKHLCKKYIIGGNLVVDN